MGGEREVEVRPRFKRWWVGKGFGHGCESNAHPIDVRTPE